MSAGAVPVRRCVDLGARGRYRLPGESRKLEAQQITVTLSPVFAELLRLMAKYCRVAGMNPSMNESRYGSQAVEVFLVDAFKDAAGLTAGEFEQRVQAGEVFDWRPVKDNEGRIERWELVSFEPAQSGVIQ